MQLFTTQFGRSSFVQARPDPDDLTFHASAEFDLVDGENLHEIWPQIVRATHPDFSAYFPDIKVSESTFLPLDLDRFLAIRCRAVSAGEKWGPNSNGDYWEAAELIRSHRTLMAKGFYVEHQSFDPANAVGIIAHAEWVPDEQYVIIVALIDKIRHARLSDHIRDMLQSKRAGVSIGCIAGEAECSICGNVARKKHQLCAHMDRGHPHYVKGRKTTQRLIIGAREVPIGTLAYDKCRNCYFYETSYTKAPADQRALGLTLRGSTLRLAGDDGMQLNVRRVSESSARFIIRFAAGEEPMEIDVPVPDEATLDKWIDRSIHDAFMTRYKKMVKDEVYRKMEEKIKKGLIKLRPAVQEAVEEKKDEVAEGVLPVGAGK